MLKMWEFSFLSRFHFSFSNIRNRLQAMAAERSGSLCVSPVNLVPISGCLLYSPQLPSWAAFSLSNMWTPGGSEARALPAKRSSAPGYARHIQQAIQLRHLQPSYLGPWRSLAQGGLSHVLQQREAGRKTDISHQK